MDVCTQCGGMFFEHGQLTRAAAPTAGDIEYSTVDLDTFEHADRYGPTTCPQCSAPPSVMRKVEFNIHTGIILDYCERCRGFWLDGRELNRINEEVRELNEASREVPDPPMLWFARLLWTRPR